MSAYQILCVHSFSLNNGTLILLLIGYESYNYFIILWNIFDCLRISCIHIAIEKQSWKRIWKLVGSNKWRMYFEKNELHEF